MLNCFFFKVMVLINRSIYDSFVYKTHIVQSRQKTHLILGLAKYCKRVIRSIMFRGTKQNASDELVFSIFVWTSERYLKAIYF